MKDFSEEEKIKSYQLRKGAVFLANFAGMFLYLFIMAYSFSQPLYNAISRFTGNAIIIIAVYTTGFYLFYFALSFGFKYYEGVVLEYWLRNQRQDFRAWLRRLLKKELMNLGMLFIVVQIVYFFLSTNTTTWWFGSSILCVMISFFTSDLFSKYVTTLFLPGSPVEDEVLKSRLINLAWRVSVKIDSVCYVQNSAVNFLVALSGYKGKRRLLLNQKIAGYAREEIEILVACELAGHYFRQIWSSLGIRAAGIFSSLLLTSLFLKPLSTFFGFQFVFEVATLPLLLGLAFMFFFVFSLWEKYLHRKMSRETDFFALQLTQAPDAFVSLIIRQNQQDLKDPRPRYFMEVMFFDEPPVSKRIALAEDFAQSLKLKKSEKKSPEKASAEITGKNQEEKTQT